MNTNPVAQIIDEVQRENPCLSKKEIIGIIRVLLDDLEEKVSFKEWKDMNINDIE